MSQPFARAQAMMSLIAAAMLSANPQAALGQIGAYRSRGKGRGIHQASSRKVAHDKRDAVKVRNRAKHKAHC